jgi:hypothetical protein
MCLKARRDGSVAKERQNTAKTAIVVGFVGAAILATVADVAAQQRGGTCVQYVKKEEPGYNKQYPGSHYWIEARELFDLVFDPQNPVTSNRKRGYTPVVDAVFVTDAFGTNSDGHTGIVTNVRKDAHNRIIGFDVTHSNWDPPFKGLVSTGTFWFDSNGLGQNGRVRYNNGATYYPLRGFVYSP